MKKITLFIIVTLLFHCGVKGNSFWVPIGNSGNGQCITITTIESNENRYRAKIEIHGYYENPIVIDDSIYHHISFDEPASLSFVGEPSLPVISRLIAIPKGENFEVVIRDEKWSEDFFVGQVMPSQRSVLESEGVPPFEKSEAIYERDEYQVERFQIGELQNWRGINNRSLNICPIKYMPKEGKISVLKDFLLDISFDVTAKANPLKSKDMRLFLNYINTEENERVELMRDSTDSYDYLIIAGDIPGVLESQALADFRKWKAFKGYRTKVVSTTTIGATDSLIQQYIINEYPKGVRYVLFIGDSDKIPLHEYYRIGYVCKSDYWYGCMDGQNDVEADLCIGRFSINSLSELTNMVNKTISYESEGRNYGKEVLLVAHNQSAPKKFQRCSDSIRTRMYNEPMYFTTAYGAVRRRGGDEATNVYVVSEINEGKNIINYRGHGVRDRWPNWNCIHESFCYYQVDSLSNATNDIYFCVACSNGAIDSLNCFMETFMRSNHGAAGMLAATGDTYNDENDSYNKSLFIKLLNENIHNMGDLNVAAHIATLTEYNFGLYSRLNAFSYLCGCDPSLEIITDSTKSFDVYEITTNGQNLIINTDSIEGYKICIINEEDSLLSVVNTDSTTCSFPIPSENSYIVLNKHNYVPRVISYLNIEDSYIQNKVFDNTDVESYYMKNATISAGYNVTTSIPNGNVIIENGSRLNISMKNGVLIKNGFECKSGGELRIK